MYQPVFKNEKKEMNIEIMKEIIFFTANRNFLRKWEKGRDKKWVVGVMTQKLGISWGLEGGKRIVCEGGSARNHPWHN
jgi:hypothetical protein